MPICRHLSLFAAAAFLLGGCASPGRHAPAAQFKFTEDTFSYMNELVWEYSFDHGGRMSAAKREPAPNYAQHCFVVARAAREFFSHARFRPDLNKVDEASYRALVNSVVNRSVRASSPEEKRVIIPGYRNLREFSVAHEALLKARCGGAWHSYAQVGNWRMVFPFSRGHQARSAIHFARALETEEPLVLHLVRFPQLTINHAIVIYEASATDEGWDFTAYDPNIPQAPLVLKYNAKTRTFIWPRSNYFAGGRVDVYRVYHGLCY